MDQADFKAVVIAAALIENGVSPTDIVIRPAGGGIRNYSKDVISVKPAPEGDYVIIQTSREGLYDMLPEGLFHRPDPYSSVTGTDSILDAIKRRKQEEKEARQFFLPFESEMYFLRIMSELFEYRVDKRNLYADLIRLFTPEWAVLEYMELWQANVFLQFVPHLHNTRGDLTFLQRLLELIFQVPVRVGLRKQRSGSFPDALPLGACRLGVDFVAGSAWDDGEDEVYIALGPLTASQATGLLPGTRDATLLDQLTRYVVPAGMDIQISLELPPSERRMDFGEAPVLNYTAYLPA
ncbi:type VI secretion system baseplate subunit TssG [Dinghuibacter silviterrae]|uniref:Type VI secretion system (T6SS) VasB/ImpH family protein n=1 Tax=Dinghuibacter silviterrae TaxID=1539049 RepID=A0A4R8DHA0_9BACT|nr:type VI secretion system baseplate subunit TssG [Dinghuibacter silviterrae]TDW96798.1 type VI secretion system (T6SS) VasB/ImpH family protein [Dinghuibacter silviterrae]